MGSFLKVLIFAVIVILTHCFYGYRATGGPAGVGVAVGRSVRSSIVLVSMLDFLLSLAREGVDAFLVDFDDLQRELERG